MEVEPRIKTPIKLRLVQFSLLGISLIALSLGIFWAQLTQPVNPTIDETSQPTSTPESISEDQIIPPSDFLELDQELLELLAEASDSAVMDESTQAGSLESLDASLSEASASESL